MTALRDKSQRVRGSRILLEAFRRIAAIFKMAQIAAVLAAAASQGKGCSRLSLLRVGVSEVGQLDASYFFFAPCCCLY